MSFQILQARGHKYDVQMSFSNTDPAQHREGFKGYVHL